MHSKNIIKREKEIKSEYAINRILAKELGSISVKRSPDGALATIKRAKEELRLVEGEGYTTMVAPVAKKIMDSCEELVGYAKSEGFSGKGNLRIARKAAMEGFLMAERYDPARGKTFAEELIGVANYALGMHRSGKASDWEEVMALKGGLVASERFNREKDSGRFAKPLIEAYGSYIKDNKNNGNERKNVIKAYLDALRITMEYKMPEKEAEIRKAMDRAK